MTARHPTIGMNGRPAKDAPPKPVQHTIICDCEQEHTFFVVPRQNAWMKVCDCGRVLRWYRGAGETVESVEAE